MGQERLGSHAIRPYPEAPLPLMWDQMWDDFSTIPTSLCEIIEKSGNWCGREDSNFHGLSATATSTLRVYQFRHDRTPMPLAGCPANW
jgi:hypothetical protein